MRPPPVTTVLGLALTSAAVLHYEITLTKVFSIVLWYHFGFLAIGAALLGFAAAGVWVARKPLPEDPVAIERVLARRSVIGAVGILLGFLLLTHSQFDTFSMIREKREVFLLVYLAETAMPFFFLGLCVVSVLSAYTASVGKVYASNLIGSAAGCVTAVVALNHLTGQESVVASFALASGGAILISMRAGIVRAAGAVVVLGGLCVLAWTYGGTAFRLLPIKSKMLASVAPERVEVSDWSSLSKVDIMSLDPTHQGLWGLSNTWKRDPAVRAAAKEKRSPIPERKGILIDEWAITSVLDPAGPFTLDNPKLFLLKYLPAGAVHRIRTGGDIVCIGAGGGLDVATALSFGQKHVTAVEINPLIVDAMTGKRYADRDYVGFSGGLYKRPDVTAVAAEGRHYLERAEKKYDIVQLSGVDTHSATEAGSFALAENFLYTVEAFRTYFEHLKPGGILTLTRWMLLKGDKPTSSLRLFALACEALQQHGIDNPAEHIYFFRSSIFTVMLVALEPFSQEDEARLDALLEEQRFQPLFRPREPVVETIAIRDETGKPKVEFPNYYRQYLAAAVAGADAKAAFLRDYPFDVSAPTDDRPFFFEHYRFRDIVRERSFLNPLGGLSSHATLALLLVIAILSGYLFVVHGARKVAGRTPVRIGLVFAAIGVAYFFVEIPLIQHFVLFLGQPSYALTVVILCLLTSSGVGSFVAGRIPERFAGRVLCIAALGAAGTAWIAATFLPTLFDTLLYLSIEWRIAVAVGALAPLGFVMGFPFPTAIRLISGGDTAWAWAMNGYGSVVATVGSMIIGIAMGFSTVMLIAITLYTATGLLGPVLLRRPDGSQTANPDA